MGLVPIVVSSCFLHMAMMTLRGSGPAFFLFFLTLAGAAYAESGISRERQGALVRLVRNDCGACHGMKLSGGLGPSLLPSALEAKDPQALRETILRGRTGTPMPPWSPFMSEEEAAWVVQQLMKGLPDAH